MPKQKQTAGRVFQELLSSGLTEELQALPPDVARALDALVENFHKQVGSLEGPAREAFSRLTLDYGKRLERFLEMTGHNGSGWDLEEHKHKIETLRHHELFAEVNGFDLGTIAGALKRRTYRRGEVLMREGSPGDGIYFLVTGEVGIYAGGNQVATRGEGNLFGEMSCLTDTPATATLRGISDCDVLVLSKEDFDAHVIKLPSVALHFARMGVARLKQATSRLGEVLSHLPNALLKLDLSGSITGDVSSKSFQFLDQEELTGKQFSAIVFKDHPGLCTQWDEAYAELVKDPGRAEDPDFPIPRSTTFSINGDGPRSYELTLFPSHDSEQLAGFDVAINDVTAQKALEEERLRMEIAMRDTVRKYLTFQKAGSIYAINIEEAKEVLHTPQLITVPRAPAFLKGMFNLRGSVLPAMDLGTLLGVPRREGDRADSALIVVEVSWNEKNRLVGLLVEEIDDILDISDSQIEPLPSFGAGPPPPFIKGFGKTSTGLRIMLELGRLLSSEQLAAVETLRPASRPDGQPGANQPTAKA